MQKENRKNIKKVLAQSQKKWKKNNAFKQDVLKKDPNSDDFLSLRQVSKKLGLDPRTVKRVAYDLGGRRFGNRWRFNWGTVMEYFKNAKFESGQRKPMVGKGSNRREASYLQILSSREEARTGMESCQGMGGEAESSCSTGSCDPFGLRKAYLVGR